MNIGVWISYFFDLSPEQTAHACMIRVGRVPLAVRKIKLKYAKQRAKGITTAAGLWATACVGIVVGSGYYIIAFVVVGLMIFAMLGLRSLAKKLRKKGSRKLKVNPCNIGQISDILQRIIDGDVKIESVKVEEDESNTNVKLDLKLSKERKVSG